MSPSRRGSSSCVRDETRGQGGHGADGATTSGADGQKEDGVTNIKVAVRCRPFSTSEQSRGEKSCFRIENGTACLENPANPADIHRFGFDLIYGGDSKQLSLWNDVGVPALEKAFAGFNTTIFAYGQTGSGKTFSMQGVGAVGEDGAGIIPRMNEQLFVRVKLEREADANKMFLVTCSYFEIYNEVVYDLLDPNNRNKKGAGLEIREHGVLGIYVKGLQEMVVTSPDAMQRLIDQGMASRTVGSTAMNDTSSRSHSVFTVKVHQKDATDESKSTFAKINLVDLAGSERAKSTGATGARLKEGANINKSLSSLGNVINALVEVANGKKGVFVPYRNSKLTRVLQESLGGNSLTAMLAALSPAACNFEETLSTLKYASRAKNIKVNAVKNEEASQVSRLEEEIRALKHKLAAQQEQTALTSSFTTLPAAGTASTAAATTAGSDMEHAKTGVADGGAGGGGRGGRGEDREEGNRYKQQIAEMEAAMKSTWEEKAKQSESSERERQRLQQQLEEEGRREERERKKRWRTLEDKGDLELSIREAKEVALPTLPASEWLGQVRALVSAENRAREEATVCAVYREALANELEGVFMATGALASGDMEDDRASAASTLSEADSLADESQNARYGIHVSLSATRDGDGGGVPARVKTTNYDPALLRQLQARLTSLRDARERLNGPLARAVEEGYADLLESVKTFTSKFSASPHGHLEREDGSARRGSAEVTARGKDNGRGGAGGGGEGKKGGETAARKRRWEARKSEGVRALAMIRRQIIARRRDRAAKGGSCTSMHSQGQPVHRGETGREGGSGSERLAQAPGIVIRPPDSRPANADSAAVDSGAEAAGLPSVSHSADGRALCPAAEVVLQAIESVLEGGRKGAAASNLQDKIKSDFTADLAASRGSGRHRHSDHVCSNSGGHSSGSGGGGGGSIVGDVKKSTGFPSEVHAVGDGGARDGAVGDSMSIRGDCDHAQCGDEGLSERNKAESERYRQILKGLAGAHGELHAAWKDTNARKSLLYRDFTAMGVNDASLREGEGLSRSGSGQLLPLNGAGEAADVAATESAPSQEAGTIDGTGSVLPHVSRWAIRCSPGGQASTERNFSDGNGDDHSELKRLREKGNAAAGKYDGMDTEEANAAFFTWAPVALSRNKTERIGNDDAPSREGHAEAPSWVEIDFGETVPVTSLLLQRLGFVGKASPPSLADFPPPGAATATGAPVSTLAVAGFRLEDADGSVERTEAMVGEIVGGWGGILKSTPPAKLLSRPPVRFLYDVCRTVSRATGFLSREMSASKWEDLTGKKEKTHLMDDICRRVADSLHLETPPAKGSDIVVGQECVATNRFLQLLVLAAHAHKCCHAELKTSDRGGMLDAPLPGGDHLAWAPNISVAVGMDGVTWEEIPIFCGGQAQQGMPAQSHQAGEALTITLNGPPSIGEKLSDECHRSYQYLKLTVASGIANHPVSHTSDVPNFVTLSVRVAGSRSHSMSGATQDGTLESRGHSEVTGVGEPDWQEEKDIQRAASEQEEAVGRLLEAMRSAVDRLLQQSLEWGRIEVANQERKTAMRTNQMESLEKQLKASHEAKSRLAKEKKSIADKATRTEEENLRLQEHVLRLRADVGKERVENTSISEKLAQAEAQVEEEKARLRTLNDLKKALEGEAEDLQNQVEVLTEERDVARSHEEHLFAKLTDQTEDLEALQESYVSLTDRWNDFQDEHDDLQEQMERLQEITELSPKNLTSAPRDDIFTSSRTRGDAQDETRDSPRRNFSPDAEAMSGDSGDRRRRNGSGSPGGGRNIRRHSAQSPVEDLRINCSAGERERGRRKDMLASAGHSPSSPRRNGPSGRSSPRRTSSASCSSPRYSSPSSARYPTPPASANRGNSARGEGLEGRTSRVTGADGGPASVSVEVHNDNEVSAVSLPAIHDGGVGSGNTGDADRSGWKAGSVRDGNDCGGGHVSAAHSLHGGDSGGYYDDDFDDFQEEEEPNRVSYAEQELQQDQQENRRHRGHDVILEAGVLDAGTTGNVQLRATGSCSIAKSLGDSKSGSENIRARVSESSGGGSSRILRESNAATSARFMNDSRLSAATRCDEPGDTSAGPAYEETTCEKRLRDSGNRDGLGGKVASNSYKSRVEVSYRPPSDGSRGGSKSERPKSAARQGRAASMNAGA